MNNRLTILDLYKAKQQGRKIVAVSCYDYTTAALAAQSDVDVIIVGDSAAQIILGHETTLPATMDFMVMMTAAVRRGAPDVCLIADMPFMSYQVDTSEALRNAARFVVEAGVQVVKIEVTSAYDHIIRAVSDAGISVMAHLGIQPQRISKLGRLRAEGTSADLAIELIDLADRMVQAGAGSLLLEGAATEAARIIAERAPVPVISCGAGPDCDGQVLVAADILGLTSGSLPKFSSRFGRLAQDSIAAFNAYSWAVRDNTFPDSDHCYHMRQGELERLQAYLGDASA